MLVHRLRRWPNIKPTLVQCILLTGIDWGEREQLLSKHKNICMAFIQRRTNVLDVRSTLYKCFVFAGYT